MNTLHRIYCSIIACCCILAVQAQLPKNLDNCRKSVFTVTTYQSDGKIKGVGFGFYISNEGVALSDYDLFKGAVKAEVVDYDGKKFNIDYILGASDLYNVVKFHIDNAKKTIPLKFAETAGTKGDSIFIIHYTTNKFAIGKKGGIENVSKFSDENYPYYTLSIQPDDKSIGCPVVNINGEVLALVQPASTSTDTQLFGIGIDFCNAQSIKALSASSKALQDIGIPKDLPETEDQALVYLYMTSGQSDKETYLNNLNRFITKYPQNSDGYMYRAQAYINSDKYQQADDDITTALKVSNKKDDVHFSFSKLLYQIALYKPKANYKDWNLDKSLSEAETAYSINPLPIYTMQEGNVLYAQQKYRQAYEKYISLTSTNLKSADLFSYAAQARKMAGDSLSTVLALQDSAIAMYTKPYIAEAAPYILNRAQTRVDARLYKAAVEDFNDYEHLNPTTLNDNFYYMREQAEVKGHMYQQAIDDMDRAIRLNKKEPLYYAEYGSLLYRAERFQEAVTALNSAIQLDPKFPDAYRILGMCLVSLGKTSEAADQFNKAKELGDATAGSLLEKYCNTASTSKK
jgi:tetratricopeptide (TPR) repeat protein